MDKFTWNLVLLIGISSAPETLHGVNFLKKSNTLQYIGSQEQTFKKKGFLCFLPFPNKKDQSN